MYIFICAHSSTTSTYTYTYATTTITSTSTPTTFCSFWPQELLPLWCW